MPPSIRVERVRELLKRELSEIIRREIPLAEVGLITVNEVDIGKDLQSATVYVGVVGTERQRKDAVARLAHSRKQLQALIGRAVVLKYTPQLRFVLDDSIQRGNRILQIIEELEASPSRHEDASQNR